MLVPAHIKASTTKILHNIDGIFCCYLNIDYVEKTSTNKIMDWSSKNILLVIFILLVIPLVI